MLAPGTVIHERYTIIRLLGQGGMGAVYEVVDHRLQRHAALKQMIAEGDPLARQFVREAQILARLRHPSLPLVSDFFATQNAQFLVMDYIPGATLAEALAERRTPFGVHEVLVWADQLLDTLAYLHQHTPPIIHRDIKPQNIKLTATSHVVLLDFGLAKGLTGSGGTTHSVFGYTPSYAPMEQISGRGTDARSDLYALGATLYTLLSGHPPVVAPQRVSALVNQQPDPLQSLSTLNPYVTVPIADVIQHMLAIEPHDRPPDSDTLRMWLRNAGDVGHIRPRLTSLKTQAQPFSDPPLIHTPPATPLPPVPQQGALTPPTQARMPPAGSRDLAPVRHHRQYLVWWYGEVALWVLLFCTLGQVAVGSLGLVIGLGMGVLALLIVSAGEG